MQRQPLANMLRGQSFAKLLKAAQQGQALFIGCGSAVLQSQSAANCPPAVACTPYTSHAVPAAAGEGKAGQEASWAWLLGSPGLTAAGLAMAAASVTAALEPWLVSPARAAAVAAPAHGAPASPTSASASHAGAGAGTGMLSPETVVAPTTSSWLGSLIGLESKRRIFFKAGWAGRWLSTKLSMQCVAPGHGARYATLLGIAYLGRHGVCKTAAQSMPR
jgi:hypothetical protein